MMELTEALVCEALQRGGGHAEASRTRAATLDFTPPWKRVSMLDAVSEKVGESVHDSRTRPAREARRAHQPAPARRARAPGGMLDELFSALVQPELHDAAFVVDYPGRDLAARARQPQQPGRGRALRAVRRRHGARERLQRAERSATRSARAFEAQVDGARAGRRGGPGARRGLPARARIRHAAHGRRRHRHRPARRCWRPTRARSATWCCSRSCAPRRAGRCEDDAEAAEDEASARMNVAAVDRRALPAQPAGERLHHAADRDLGRGGRARRHGAAHGARGDERLRGRGPDPHRRHRRARRAARREHGGRRGRRGARRRRSRGSRVWSGARRSRTRRRWRSARA